MDTVKTTGASSSAGARRSVTYAETPSVAPSSSGPRAVPSHLLVDEDVETGLEEAGYYDTSKRGT
jgi:hypothetical protein